MKVEDVMRCNFTEWYMSFSDVTAESIVLPVPEEFLEYLNSDSIVLPKGSRQGVYTPANQSDDNSDEEAVDWSPDWSLADTCQELMEPDLAGLENEINEAIRQLGGKVFPKLNWSSPQDSNWNSFNRNLQCFDASDVCLLMKSSELINNDLTEPFRYCEDRADRSMDVTLRHDLVLRRWQDIHNDREFRCFVYCDKLIGICQRNTQDYSQLIIVSKDDIQEDIHSFFVDIIDGNFGPRNSSYTFDVWRERKGHVTLVDFNPFGRPTDPLLFDSWELLLSPDIRQLEFRCVENCSAVRPGLFDRFHVPTDFSHFTSVDEMFKQMELMTSAQQIMSSDDEGECVDGQGDEVEGPTDR